MQSISLSCVPSTSFTQALGGTFRSDSGPTTSSEREGSVPRRKSGVSTTGVATSQVQTAMGKLDEKASQADLVTVSAASDAVATRVSTLETTSSGSTSYVASLCTSVSRQ